MVWEVIKAPVGPVGGREGGREGRGWVQGRGSGSRCTGIMTGASVV